MKLQWISAVMLGAALAAGCGDKDQQNTGNSDQTVAAPAPETPADIATAPPPPTDNSAARTDSSARRPLRPAPATPAPAPRREAAAREIAPAPPVVHEVTVPAGTSLPLELTTAVSSETATVETPVQARLREPIEINGRTALPAGTVFHGSVTDVARAGRVQGRSRLAFRFDSATVNGVKEDLRTNPVSFEGEASKGDDAKKIGVGAGIGAAIGAIAGGGGGAAKGAAIGGAAGTGAVLATRGKDVELSAGTEIAATTAGPVTVESR